MKKKKTARRVRSAITTPLHTSVLHVWPFGARKSSSVREPGGLRSAMRVGCGTAWIEPLNNLSAWVGFMSVPGIELLARVYYYSIILLLSVVLHAVLYIVLSSSSVHRWSARTLAVCTPSRRCSAATDDADRPVRKKRAESRRRTRSKQHIQNRAPYICYGSTWYSTLSRSRDDDTDPGEWVSAWSDDDIQVHL